MTGTDKVILVLGLSMIFAICWCWKAWIDELTRQRERDHELTLKSQQTEIYRIIAGTRN